LVWFKKTGDVLQQIGSRWAIIGKIYKDLETKDPLLKSGVGEWE